jgi:uncharacterized membrane protein
MDPNAPVAIPLPGFGEVITVDSVSDQEGTLQQLFSSPSLNQSEPVGTFYLDRDANEIITYPHAILTNGFYEYQLSAKYEAGIKGATTYAWIASAKEIIWLLPNPNSNAAPNQNMTFLLRLTMPSGTSPDSTTTSGYSHTLLGDRWQLIWESNINTAHFVATQFVVGYQINIVQRYFYYSLPFLIASIAFLILSLMKVIGNTGKWISSAVPLLVTPSVLQAAITYLSPGPFQVEFILLTVVSFALFLMSLIVRRSRWWRRRLPMH